MLGRDQNSCNMCEHKMSSQVWDDDGLNRVARQRNAGAACMHVPREVGGPGRLAGLHVGDGQAADRCVARSNRSRYRYLGCSIAC